MSGERRRALPPHLAAVNETIREHARGFGLDFFEVVFERLNWDEVNMVAAYGGYPVRYPHWKWGMEYERLSKSYEYGLSRIYELVINNDPTYAYLLEANSDVEQKMVMAHVYGHADFFKHNFAFGPTNRKMIDQMANHATKVRRMQDKLGVEPVEAFVDRCLSLENLIDRHAPYVKRDPSTDAPQESDPVRGLKADREYMKSYINPKEYLDKLQKEADAEKAKKKNFPERPARDVLGFLAAHAPLEDWERDVLELVRDEAYYFAPQGMTKIMNEGWASYWHSRIMTTRALEPSELLDYADRHAGVVAQAQGQLNPYRMGIELFRDIEDRWNKGKFGKEWDDCDDLATRQKWDKGLGRGLQKIFEVRRFHTDVTFLDEFLTPEFAFEQQLFTFGYNDKHQAWTILSRDFKAIKAKLLQQLTNGGQPVIEVVDGNAGNRSELLLAHRHDGVDLKLDWAKETLANLHAVWRRPVTLHTRADDKGLFLSFDGTKHEEKKGELPT